MDVYLLGAGFSSDAGVPTMKNFLDALKRLAAEKPPGREKRLFENTLDFARQEGETHIEKLLVKALNKPVFDDLVWTFALTVNQMSAAYCRGQSKRADWYRNFARLLCETGARVITFNYDLVLEEMLTCHTRCSYDYGLRFDAQSEKNVSPPSGKKAIALYKLHGSVSFLFCAQCGFLMNAARHAVSLELAPCPRCGRKLAPLLLPPTFRKPWEFGRHVLQELWEKANVLFETGTRFIVGGLSFNTPDMDIKNRFLRGIKSNPHVREIVLVNHNRQSCRALALGLPTGISVRRYKSFREFTEAETALL